MTTVDRENKQPPPPERADESAEIDIRILIAVLPAGHAQHSIQIAGTKLKQYEVGDSVNAGASHLRQFACRGVIFGQECQCGILPAVNLNRSITALRSSAVRTS